MTEKQTNDLKRLSVVAALVAVTLTVVMVLWNGATRIQRIESKSTDNEKNMLRLEDRIDKRFDRVERLIKDRL